MLLYVENDILLHNVENVRIFKLKYFLSCNARESYPFEYVKLIRLCVFQIFVSCPIIMLHVNKKNCCFREFAGDLTRDKDFVLCKIFICLFLIHTTQKKVSHPAEPNKHLAAMNDSVAYQFSINTNFIRKNTHKTPNITPQIHRMYISFHMMFFFFRHRDSHLIYDPIACIKIESSCELIACIIFPSTFTYNKKKKRTKWKNVIC